MNIKLRLSCEFQIIINIFVIFMAAVVPNSSFANSSLDLSVKPKTNIFANNNYNIFANKTIYFCY